MQPHRERPPRAAEHCRRARRLESLPRDQHQHLAITGAQRRKCLPERGRSVRVSVRRTDALVAQPVKQGRLPARGPSLIGDDPLGTRQQPRQCVGRDLLQTSPRDHEHVADDVVGRLRSYPAPRVCPHGRGMLREQPFEPNAPIEIVHNQPMSATPAAITRLGEVPAYRSPGALRGYCDTGCARSSAVETIRPCSLAWAIG